VKNIVDFGKLYPKEWYARPCRNVFLLAARSPDTDTLHPPNRTWLRIRRKGLHSFFQWRIQGAVGAPSPSSIASEFCQ